jgi:hypothetical protein
MVTNCRIIVTVSFERPTVLHIAIYGSRLGDTNVPMTVFSGYYSEGILCEWKPEYPEKTTDLSLVTDKLYHIMLYTVHLAIQKFKKEWEKGVTVRLLTATKLASRAGYGRNI